VRRLRGPLSAIVALWLAAAFAPQALAQTCGPAINLAADQWRMVAVSCVPNANKTISDFFSPSLGAANYGVTWIVWKRVYNNPSCVVASGPSDCYVKLTLTSPVSTGDAFWVYSTLATSLQFNNSQATTTPGPYFEFPAVLSTDGNSRYYMFGNPYAGTVNWADFGFPIVFLGFLNFTLSTQQAVNNSIVSKDVYYWNGTNTYFTRDLTTSPNPAATFTSKQAAWLEMLQPSGLISNVRVRVPQP